MILKFYARFTTFRSSPFRKALAFLNISSTSRILASVLAHARWGVIRSLLLSMKEPSGFSLEIGSFPRTSRPAAGKRFVKGVLPNIIWEYKIAAHRTHSYEQRFCVMLWMELFNKTLLASFKNGSHTDKTQTLLYDLRFSYCIFSSFFVASPDAHKIRSYSWYL